MTFFPGCQYEHLPHIASRWIFDNPSLQLPPTLVCKRGRQQQAKGHTNNEERRMNDLFDEHFAFQHRHDDCFSNAGKILFETFQITLTLASHRWDSVRTVMSTQVSMSCVVYSPSQRSKITFVSDSPNKVSVLTFKRTAYFFNAIAA